jgi:rubrerythrin
MSSIKGTKTEQNLLKSFTGESRAHNRYTNAALQASKEGHEHIAAFFEGIASQEKIHAEYFFSCLEDTPQEIAATEPATEDILSTEESLKNAIAGEHEEWANIYPECARIAKEEGFPDVAQLFINIASAEKQHEKRYLGFLKSLKDDLTPYEDETIVQWCCRNCGFVSSTPTAPQVCSICKMPQDWFDLLTENG